MHSRSRRPLGVALATACLLSGLACDSDSRVDRAPSSDTLRGTVDSARTPGARDTLEFRSVGDLYTYNEADPQVRGGVPTNPAEFPASFFDAALVCSATLVGPDVVLTAAHCVDDVPLVRLSTPSGMLTARCEIDPGYDEASGRDRDWALCKLDDNVGHVTRLETIQTDSTFLEGAESVLLSGFGCSDSSGAGIGVFRTGAATILATPPGSNFIVTSDSVALCMGDSGGAAFLSKAESNRYQVSVNGLTDLAGERSYLVRLNSAEFLRFARDWQVRNDAEICGLSDHPYCRAPRPGGQDDDP